MTTTLVKTVPLSPVPAADTRLRICHVSLTLCTGGLERLLVDFARFHDRTKWQVDFLAMGELGPFADQIRDAGCTVRNLESTTRTDQVRELKRILKRERYSLVHTHNTYPHLYATLAARWARVPVVVNTRHGQRFGQTWKARLQYRWTAKLVDRIIGVSEDAAQLTKEEDGVPARKIQRIWNGIDLEGFAWHGPVKAPIAISVARLSPEKDIATMLEAVALAISEVPRLKLKLVGDGAQRKLLEQKVRELEIAHAVEFLGERRDVPEQLQKAGFFLSSSLSEGISLTLLEAMACGLPVIATRVGGNAEIVDEGLTGRLVPAGDPQALSRAIIEHCRQIPSWHEMGRRGRKRVEEHFDIRRMVRDYEELYGNLLLKKRVLRNS